MQFIKGGFSFRLKIKLDVWMRGFNQTQILSEEKFAAAVRYIEQNPVRRGLAQSSSEYAYRSADWRAPDSMPAHMRQTTRA